MMKKAAMTLFGVTAIAALVGCSATNTTSTETETTATAKVTSEFSQELFDALPAEIQESKKISVVGETNQPWRIVGADGELTGFQVELQKEFAEILGVEFENDLVVGLPAVKLGVESGRNDMAFGPLLSTASTQEDLIFVEHTVGRPSFVYSVDDEEITSVLDMCGKTISHLEGSVAFDNALKTIDENCTADGQETVTRIPLADINAVVLSVESNRADLGGMGAHQAAYSEAENPDKFVKYISSEEEFKSDKLAAGFAPDNLQLAEVIAEAWQITLDNGVYYDLMERYNMSEITVDEIVLVNGV